MVELDFDVFRLGGM